MGFLAFIAWNHLIHYVVGACVALALWPFLESAYKEQYWKLVFMPLVVASGFPDMPFAAAVLLSLVHCAAPEPMAVYAAVHYGAGILLVIPFSLAVAVCANRLSREGLPRFWWLVASAIGLAGGLGHTFMDSLGF